MDAMEAFLAYAGRYDADNTKIHLKIVHTQAVDAVMERLSGSLGLDARMRRLAHLCAVYHDIGRFEQLKRYDTFLDHLSVDHAQLGCEVITRSWAARCLEAADFWTGCPKRTGRWC